ncbi:MAG: DUF3048 domain-containing protein [Lachnospiraceae bacterium]|nr:DUF3048 domain-containing protein [Lachnospiraceae bacterium]
MNKKLVAAVAAIILVIIGVLLVVRNSGGTKEPETASTSTSTVSETENTNEPAQSSEPASGEVSEAAEEGDQLEPGMMRSYLSGLPVDEKIGNRRPIAIMLNNLEAAQPMCGISRADVVYEYVVEGGITRLMGLFENYDDLDKIGSVRSCREYFVYTALEFDAIYMHFGQAAYAVDLLNQDYVDNLNGLGEAGDTSFYRTTDRQAPHNVYTSSAGIEAGIKKLGYRQDHYDGYTGKFRFCGLNEVVTNDTGASAVHIEPNYKINKPWFEYNPETEKYDRYQYGGPQIDEMTGEQLSYDNVILQYNKWSQLDQKDYLAFDCHSGGIIQYCTKGKFSVGTWQRDVSSAKDGNVDQAPIRYYTMEGEEIKINNGKTFICVIQDTDLENIVLE